MRLLKYVVIMLMLLPALPIYAQEELNAIYTSPDGQFTFHYPEREAINDFWEENRLISFDYREILISIQVLDPLNPVIGSEALPVVSEDATLAEVYEIIAEGFEVSAVFEVEETNVGENPAIYALWEYQRSGEASLLLFQLENGSFIRAMAFGGNPEDYRDFLTQVAETIVYSPPSEEHKLLVTTITSQTEGYLLTNQPSPDFQWFAGITHYNCTMIEGRGEIAYETMSLISSDGGEPIEITSQLSRCDGIGIYGLQILFWSENSRYFYYTDAREGVPDGGCGFWTPPILRVDVTDASIAPLGEGYISPDSTKLATWQNQELILSDASEGELARLPIYDAALTLREMFWLPDSSGVIYVLADFGCGPATQTKVVFIRMADLQQSLLIETDQ